MHLARDRLFRVNQALDFIRDPLGKNNDMMGFAQPVDRIEPIGFLRPRPFFHDRPKIHPPRQFVVKGAVQIFLGKPGLRVVAKAGIDKFQYRTGTAEGVFQRQGLQRMAGGIQPGREFGLHPVELCRISALETIDRLFLVTHHENGA